MPITDSYQSRGVLHPKSLSQWEKGTAQAFAPEGGSDPKGLLGGLPQKKWGRSRPISPFSHGDFPFPLFRISPCFKHFGPPGVKPVAISSMQSATITFFTRAQQNQHERDRFGPQDKRVKAHHVLPVIGSNRVADSAVADVTVLPTAIQPFKSLPREPAPHLVAENQISLAYFSVALLLPRLPHSEVPKQVLGNVR